MASFSNVLIEGAPEGVIVGEPNQVGGPLVFTVSGNDFHEASPELPILFFIRFSHHVQLQEFNVGWPSEDPNVLRLNPIILPLELVGAPAGSRLVAPSDSVYIVRWLADESKLWLGVRRSTSQWILNEHGELVNPSHINGSVSFRLGFSESEYSDHYLPLYQAGIANAPTIERRNLWQESTSNLSTSLSTRLVLNMIDSTLSVCPAPRCQVETDLWSYQMVSSTPIDYLTFTFQVGGLPSALFQHYGLHTSGSPTVAFGIGSTQVPALSDFKIWFYILGLVIVGLLVLNRKLD